MAVRYTPASLQTELMLSASHPSLASTRRAASRIWAAVLSSASRSAFGCRDSLLWAISHPVSRSLVCSSRSTVPAPVATWASVLVGVDLERGQAVIDVGVLNPEVEAD